MPTDLWLNLPVSDLARSVVFYEALGLERNPGPGNSASSASFVVGAQRVVLMLFAQPVFTGFAGAPVADAKQAAEVLISIGANSPAEVDDLAARAVAGGGTVYAQPGPPGGAMYGCGLCDPDGHRWNVLYMAPR
jgi:predicted lactoylglutathione lyase